jgi:hypothetical protein
MHKMVSALNPTSGSDPPPLQMLYLHTNKHYRIVDLLPSYEI